MKELVLNSNGQPVTNSVLVAEKFGKQHKNVIASIRALLNKLKIQLVKCLLKVSMLTTKANHDQCL